MTGAKGKRNDPNRMLLLEHKAVTPAKYLMVIMSLYFGVQVSAGDALTPHEAEVNDKGLDQVTSFDRLTHLRVSSSSGGLVSDATLRHAVWLIAGGPYGVTRLTAKKYVRQIA